MSANVSQITGFSQPFRQAQIKENIKALRHWPLWEEFAGDRWITIKFFGVRGRTSFVSAKFYNYTIHYMRATILILDDVITSPYE